MGTVGWTPNGPAGFDPEFAEATSPHGSAAQDPDFIDGTGSDTITYRAQVPAGAALPLKVRATLYTQSIPPGYLWDRFTHADGPATRRLHYLAADLDDQQTFFPNWKLMMRQEEAPVP